MKLERKLSVRLHDLLKSEFENSSQNLKRFARKRNYMKDQYRILKHDDILYIGMKDDNRLTVGAKLLRVACGVFDTYAFMGIDDAEDVTEWFISEYKAKGMCAYADMRHDWHQGAHDEDLDDGDKRQCSHCGKVEVLHSRMVRKIWWE